MKHDCEHCYHFIIQRGFFPHYVCLAYEDYEEKPEPAKCPRWEAKPKWMDTRGKEASFQRF